jgi:Recombination endonuclease VII
MRKYGITLEEKRKMYDDQLGLCKMCNLAMFTASDCNVDHDHRTKRIRGLIHRHCNLLIGLAKDNPSLLQKAIEYLKTS